MGTDYENKGAMAATVVVAASDSLNQAAANYICDGTADEVEINLALNAVVAVGGRVILLDGTFTLAAPIVFPGNNIILEGQGRSTFIDGDALTTGNHGIELTGRTGCTIKNLAIQTQDGGGKTCHCIFVDDGCDNLTIDSVAIIDSDSDGIHIEGTNHLDIHIYGLRVDDVDANGIQVNMDAVNYCDRLIINEAIVMSAGSQGIYLRNCRYSEIANCILTLNAAVGILIGSGSSYCNLSNCISILNGQEGIRLSGCTQCIVEGCTASINVFHGIHLNSADECIVSACLCKGNDSGHSSSFDGIHVDGGSENNLVVGNRCCENDRYGINCTGERNSIVENLLEFNGQEGIYVAGYECLIKGNYVYDNGQEAAGTYHGIVLTSGADRTSVTGNYLNSPGDSQEDGIHLDDGAIRCQINDNYCYYGMGSGIALTANNDNCLIENNYCLDNDDYGIEITAATCDKCVVRGNHLIGNVTAQILDSGTLTQVDDDNEGITLKDIKVYRTVKNTSGGALAAGDVVVIKGIASDIEMTTTTTQGDDLVYGMVAEVIAINASGYVLVKGYTTALKVNGTVDIAINDPLGTFTVAKIAMKAAAGDQGFALALEAYATNDSAGVIDAYLKSPWD